MSEDKKEQLWICGDCAHVVAQETEPEECPKCRELFSFIPKN